MNDVLILVPVFNRFELFWETFLSLIYQAYIIKYKRNLSVKIIIVDDSSNEKLNDFLFRRIFKYNYEDFVSLCTKNKIFNKYYKFNDFNKINKFLRNDLDLIKVIRNDRNYGVSYSRNIAFLYNSNFILFLDSDDIWLKNHFDILYNEFVNNNNLDLVFTDEIWYRDSNFVNKPRKFVFDENILKKQKKYQVLPISNIFINLSKYKKKSFYKFNETMEVCEDYEFIRKCIDSKRSIVINKSKTSVKRGGRIDQLSYIYRSKINSFFNKN